MLARSSTGLSLTSQTQKFQRLYHMKLLLELAASAKQFASEA